MPRMRETLPVPRFSGAQLKAARRSAGLSRQALVQRIETLTGESLSHDCIVALETGRSRSPSYRTVQLLALGLDVGTYAFDACGRSSNAG